MKEQVLTFIDQIQKKSSDNSFYNKNFYCAEGGCEEQSQSGYCGSYFCDGCSLSVTEIAD
jgi:hypothetical protein